MLPFVINTHTCFVVVDGFLLRSALARVGVTTDNSCLRASG